MDALLFTVRIHCGLDEVQSGTYSSPYESLNVQEDFVLKGRTPITYQGRGGGHPGHGR